VLIWQQLIDVCKLFKGAAHHSNGVTPFTFALFANLSTSNLAYSVLELTARTAKAVPPFHVPHPGSVVEKLTLAGIYSGSYHSSNSVNLTSAENEAITAVESCSGSAFKDLNNG